MTNDLSQPLSTIVRDWHASATTLDLEAFPACAMVLLQTRLPFCGVVWDCSPSDEDGAASEVYSASPDRDAVQAAIRHRDRIQDLRGPQALQDGGPFDVDGGRSAVVTRIRTVRDSALHRQIGPVLIARHAAAGRRGSQFIALTRSLSRGPFTPTEAGDFDLLAPQLMQAYATCLKFTLATARFGETSTQSVAAALVDPSGWVRDEQPHFMPTMQREWPDWPGRRLPEPLDDLARSRAGTSWRYLGKRISADFSPIGGLWLVTARTRQAIDSLTERESEVARRYAEGDEFRQIASTLRLSPATVRSHLRNVFAKLNVRNKAQLTALLR